jgi:hypothetical protein
MLDSFYLLSQVNWLDVFFNDRFPLKSHGKKRVNLKCSGASVNILNIAN